MTVIVPLAPPRREYAHRLTSLEGDTAHVLLIQLLMRTIETKLDHTLAVIHGSGHTSPLQSQVHRNPINVDGRYLFDGRPDS